jgi:hypothetical protein
VDVNTAADVVAICDLVGQAKASVLTDAPGSRVFTVVPESRVGVGNLNLNGRNYSPLIAGGRK